MLKGNKGEWSEIYTLFKLLGDGKLYAADGELNKKDDIFYDILKVIRNEQIGTLHFVFDGDEHVVNVENDAGEIKVSVSSELFKTQADLLYGKIVNTKGTAAFEVIETSEFMQEILCSKLKAPSADKSDITIKVHDFNTGLNPTLGFSIKSRLGKPATLLNAGVNTNFIFEICGNITDDKMNEINNLFVETNKNGTVKHDISVAARMKYITDNGLSLKFSKMNGPTFQNNLVLIDSDLPAIVGYTMLEYYQNGTNNLKEAIAAVADKNPLNYDLSQGHKYYQYKFKKLLTESALGMLPGKVWTGRADANGGYIIVREDGEVLCYHLYNRNDFEDYLLGNTRFDRGGAGRHEYAVVTKSEDKYYIALNLQIRFLK
ncbi:MAG: HpaII family restriction endonuclease [Clostridia bacterium]|nr:HpaII family restriction endonuclease [Clostridia bacterium]